MKNTLYYLTYSETKTTVKKTLLKESIVTVHSNYDDFSSISESFDDVKAKYNDETSVWLDGAEQMFVDKLDPLFGEYKEAGYRHKNGSEHTIRVMIASYFEEES